MGANIGTTRDFTKSSAVVIGANEHFATRLASRERKVSELPHGMYRLLLIGAACFSLMLNFVPKGLAMTVTQTTNPSDFVNALGGGSGGLTITSVTINSGASAQFGTYTGFNIPPVTIGDGFVLSNGQAIQTTAAYHSTDDIPSNDEGEPGTPEFNAYGPGHITNFTASYDVASLTVNFTLAKASQVAFDFIFGSVEYPDYTNEYTDSFVAFLDGTGVSNQIVFDGSNNAVQVGSSFAGALTTSDSNTAFSNPHGLVSLTTFTQNQLSAGAHSITFEVGDVNDHNLDSAAFITNLRAATGTGGTNPNQPPSPGFYPINLAPYANAPIEDAITTVPAPPVGNVTLGGVPFDIPGPLGVNNIWDGNVAVTGTGEAAVTVPVNMPDISEVHILVNTAWGKPGVHAYVDLVFDAGTYTRDLKGDNDIRDYQNWKFTNHVNGVTTAPVFTGLSTLDNVPGRIDEMVIPVPPAYQGAHLLAVKMVDDGRPDYQRILFMGLTVRVGSGITVAQPTDNLLYSDVSTVSFGTVKIGKSAELEFTVENSGTTTVGNLKATVINAAGNAFTAAPKELPSLAPGTSTTFAATYAPTIGGPDTATLYVTSTDLAIPSFDLALTGTGETPDPQAGTYIGLLNGGSSFVTLTLAKTGSLTGKLVLDGTTYKIDATVATSGDFSGIVVKPPLPVGLTLEVSGDGSTPGDYLISGTAGGVTLTAAHAAYDKGGIVAEAGTYTLLLSATGSISSVPLGTGYAKLTVNKTGGGARMACKLADGTPLTATGVLVSGGGGNQFIIYDPALYGGKGLLAGAITFEALAGSDCDGTLAWIKPSQTSGNYYKGGFDTDLAAAGSLYVKPPAGQSALPITSGTVELSDGGLNNPINEPVNILPSNAVTVVGTNAQHLKIAIHAGTGGFTGSFVDPVTNKTITFGGLLFQKVPQGGGFFRGPVVSGTGLSGNVSLEPQ